MRSSALAAYPIANYTAKLEQLSEDERVAAALAQASQIFPELDKVAANGSQDLTRLNVGEEEMKVEFAMFR